MMIDFSFIIYLYLSLKFEHSRADGGDDTAVDEQVGAVDEGGMLAQEERGGIGYFVAGSYAAGSRGIDHGLITVAIGIELVVGQRGDDDAWRNGVDAGTALAPSGGCGTLRLQVVHALGNHVGKA